VLEPDAGEDSDIGLHDIGGVEAATKAHLYDGCFHRLLDEEGKGHRRGQLEIRELGVAAVLENLGESGDVRDGQGELVLGGDTTVDPEPLLDPFEVRRDEAAG
jgi:hypothetical protein